MFAPKRQLEGLAVRHVFCFSSGIFVPQFTASSDELSRQLPKVFPALVSFITVTASPCVRSFWGELNCERKSLHFCGRSGFRGFGSTTRESSAILVFCEVSLRRSKHVNGPEQRARCPHIMQLSMQTCCCFRFSFQVKMSQLSQTSSLGFSQETMEMILRSTSEYPLA